MKPSTIFSVLDTALEARKINEVFNPLFTGEAGLGKSQIVQQWVQKQRERNPNFGFLDLRIAYMEAPDLIGLPENELSGDGTKITNHYLPDFWPRGENSEGLLLLEEPNRGTTGVMNCLMQLLTDRKVHKYELPKGWIIAGCVNPDSSEYDVNTMDAALKDRFEEFEVEYDALTFMDYIDSSNWHDNVQMFIKSGIWSYKTTKEIAKDAKYISPRTWSKVNAAEKAGIAKTRNLHRICVQSVLGKDIGNEYHKFCFDQAPVTAQDLIKDKDRALERLKQQSNPSTYQGDMIAATVESIEKYYGGLSKDCKPEQIDEDTMAEVAKIIPADHAVNLIKACGFKQSKGQITAFFGEFTKRHPELVKVLKDNIKISRATGVDKSSKK
jgi:hypothetical protein